MAKRGKVRLEWALRVKDFLVLGQRRRLALAINLVVLCGVICVAVVSSDSSDWQPLELVLVLGAFAIASDCCR